MVQTYLLATKLDMVKESVVITVTIICVCMFVYGFYMVKTQQRIKNKNT